MGGLSLALVLFAVGACLVAGILVLARLRQERTQLEAVSVDSVVPVNLTESQNAVLVAEGRGQLVFANEKARRWFNLNGGAPNLELMSEYVEPTDAFLELFGSEGHASFRVGARRVEATSHYIPRQGTHLTTQMVVVLRELDTQGYTKERIDPIKAMTVIEEVAQTISSGEKLPETLNSVLRALRDVLDFNAGEINLWDEDLRIMRPGGRSGEGQYFEEFEQTDGIYHLDDSLSGWLARYRQPLLIADLSRRPDVHPKLKELAFTAFMGVPLLINERLIGTIELVSRVRGAFTHEDLTFLQTVSGQVAIAIQNARLSQNQTERMIELSGLQDIATAMSTLEDPRKMYAHLTSRIAALMNVEMCGVLLHDADQDALVTQLPFFGVPDAVVNVYRIPLQEGTPARAIFNAREWWFSNSVRTDDLVRQLSLNGLAEALGVRTTALVPLTIGDRRYGVVQVANKRDGSGFNETDLRLLVVFASQVAVVVESARLRQEERDRNEQLGGLQQITRTLSVLNDPAELYAQVVERVSRLMGVNVCGILLHDAEHHLLVGQQPFVGIDPALVRYYQVPFVPESKLFQRINRRGYWISNNLAEDTAIRDSGVDKMAMMLALQHSLLVPLDANGQRLGFIQVANKINGLGFTEEDARSLITLAEQSASLLADARTYRDTRYRADVAAGMQRLAEIVSSSTTLDQLASGAASVVRALLNCDLTTLWILNEATGELRAQPEWASGIEGQLPQPLTLDVYAPGNETSPVISRRPFISNDVLNDGRVLPLYRAVAERFQVLSVMQVPLVARDHVLGELTAAHRAPERDFTSDDLRLAQAICAQLAAGLERLQLYQATDQTMQARVRQLDTINRISAELTETTNLDDVLEIIRAELGRAADSDLATVVWLKPSADWLSADDPILERRLGHTRGFLELAPIEHRAIRNGGMVIVNDYDLSDIDAMPIRARSAIAAPIFYGDTPVGALHVFSEKADALPPQVQDFVRALASQATIGIGNALRLRQQTQRSELIKQRAEQFTHIFELGRMINAEGGTESVLNAIARGITEVVGFNIAVISLVERHTTIMQVAAYAGVPEADLPALLKNRPKLGVIEQLLQPRYRIGNAYFLPAEDPTLQAVEQEVGFIEPKLSYARTGAGAWDPHDVLIVPLRNPSGGMIGMISVDDPRDGKRPSVPVIETLEVFANQAVAAVENYRLLQAFQGEADSAREERDRLERLYLVAGEIQRATDVPTRLKVVADSICAVGWGRVAITLRDAKLDPRETITAGFNEEDEAAFRMNVLPGMVWGPRLSDPEFRRLRIGQAYYIRYDSAWVTENKRIAGISAGTSGEHFIPTDPAYPPDKWHPLDTLYLPLYGLDRSRLIGIITMDRPQDGRVPVEDTLRSIELFAAQAASAIENTRLYDETVRAATQEARINEMMEAVASTLELDEIIEGIAGGMRDMIAFTRMSVMLVDEDRDEFEVRRVTLGMRGEIAIDSGEPIPVEDTAVGLAVRDAKTTLYHIADANRLPALHDLKTWWMTGERTTLIIPMVAGGRVTGALHMGSELSDAFGFEEQIPLLSRMANLAAIAIENAQLFQQSIDRERFSTAVGRIGQAVSTSALTDKTSVLRFICEETVNLLDVSGAYIWLVDGNDLVGIAAHGLSAEDITNHRQPLSSTSIEAAIVRERAPHMITGVQKAESQFSHTAISVPSVYSILGVPLLREDMPIGVMICVQADARALFTDNDIEKMNTLAVQASIALESARLYDDVGTRAQQLSVLTEVSGELAATLEMDAVVQMLLDRLGTILLFDRVTLWLRRGDRLVIRSARGFDDVEGLIGVEAEIADSALFRDLASRGQVLNIPDISKDERFPFSDASPTRSWLGVSLVSRGNLIGLLVMEKSEVAYYSPTMEQLALTFANQAAISLENARLYQEATRTAAENTRLYNETALRARKLDQQAKRLALLNQVSNALTQSPDVENIFDVTLREIVTILGVERGTAILFEERPQGRFVYEFPRGDSPPEEADIAILLNDPSPLLEELRRVMLPTIVQNVTTDPRVSAARDSLVKRNVLSILIVPMVIGGQMIGTLNFEATETNRDFSPEQLEVTQTIAAQAVVAVQNANLFEQSLLRTRELETLFEATQATTSTLNLQEVLSNTANQMLFSLQVDACQILFWNDVEDHLLVQLDMTPMGVNERGDVPGTSYDLTLYPMRERALKARQMLQMRTSSGAESLTDAERSLMQRRNAAARILLPLSVREQTIGLIEIESHDPFRNFTVSDVRMARTLASQAAVAIDNARLNTETSVKLVELLEINELSTSLAKAIELEQIFDVVRKRLPALIKAQIWVLAYLGEDKLTVSYPIALREGQPMNLPNHLVGDDEISFVINRRSAQRLAGHEIEEVLRNLKISRRILQVRCFLGVPLVSGDEVVGALILGDEANIRAFNLDVQRVLSTIGAQIAIAIQNARLFARSRQFAAELEQAVKDRTSELQEERDRIQFLYRITTDLALSLDLEVVLKRALELMAEAVDADMGAILGIDSLSESLTYRTALNMPGINLEDNTPLSQHEGLAGWVIQSQQSVIVDDVQADPRWLRLSEADDDPRSAMAVLLESNEDIYGVVMLYSRTQGKFDDNQLRLVAAACNQVASAMNNAELYGLIREQAERLGMMVRREQVDSTKNLAIVESIADGVMVADAMGDITQFNSAAERILDVRRADLIGRSIGDLGGLYSSTGGKRWFEEMQRWIAAPTAHRPDSNFTAQVDLDNGKTIQVILSPVLMSDQFLGTVSVIRDVTREIEVDRMKSEFVATVSHELRTPMTSIKGYADLLLIGAAGTINEQQQKFLGTIKTNADRLSALVNDLLDISRIDRGNVKLNFQPIDVSEVIEGTVRHLNGRIQNDRKPMSISNDVPGNLPAVRADFDKLTQIVNNLGDNAFNYTYPNGEIHLTAYADGDSVVLCVKDTGIGIPKDKQDRIWNRFFRDEEQPLVLETSGTGLGLAIVREYVEMHDGHIWLESEPGQGTTFFVRIPTYTLGEGETD